MNLSYCRFRNTLADLNDCEGALWEATDEVEARARARLIELCHAIAESVPLDEIKKLPVEE